MALSDLAVYSEYAYSAMMEVIAQQIELFNSASRGGIVLRSAAHVGDYSDVALWARISGLVRRRDAYGSGAIATASLEHLVNTMVKVAAGTPCLNIDPGQFKWIQQNPEIAGALIGAQLAEETLADMLNTGLMAFVAATVAEADVYEDNSSADLDLAGFNEGQAKFGDRANALLCWVMHSKPIFDLYGAAITNGESLFQFGTVFIKSDPFGRPMIISDSPSLIDAGSPDHYFNCALTAGAIRVELNGDFTDNIDTLNGEENILRTYQAEWSYQLGLKGYAWDKTSGGPSPTNAALATASNWDRYATSHKDLAGVIVETR